MRLLTGYMRQPYVWYLDKHSADLTKTVMHDVDNMIGSSLLPSMRTLTVACLVNVLVISCSEDTGMGENRVCATDGLLWEFTDPEGVNGYVYEDGSIYILEEDACRYIDQYFDPDFRSGYVNNGVNPSWISESDTIPKVTDYNIDFESSNDIIDLIAVDLESLDKVWTTFTLQSPGYPKPEDYNALKSCILEGNCDFEENSIRIVPDPYQVNNSVLQFVSWAASPDMVTSKCSIGSDLFYFEKGDDIWFEARFLIQDAYPTTLVDFESSYFLAYPGPRVMISGDAIAIENKFGEKVSYKQEGSSIPVPMNNWFTLKVHLELDDENGVIEVWQHDSQIINTMGRNIHLPFSIQNSLEVGISASTDASVVYVDDIKISGQSF